MVKLGDLSDAIRGTDLAESSNALVKFLNLAKAITLFRSPRRKRKLKLNYCSSAPENRDGYISFLFDSKFLNPISQGAKRHSQYLGGCRLVVPSLFQRLDDGVALDFLEMITKCSFA
jgi:hypothetical protein